MHRQPLPGPLDVDPAGEVANLQTARLQLAEALTGTDLGAHDRQVIAWLTGTDASRVATVASLLRRAFEAGVQAGRAEQVDEIPVIALLQDQVAGLMEAKAAARAEADDALYEVKALARQLDAARATVERVNGWWRDAQAERDEARQDVEGLAADVERLRAEIGRRERIAGGLVAERKAAESVVDQIVAAAAEIEARFDAEKVSAQGAFERLLAVITDAGQAESPQARTDADGPDEHWSPHNHRRCPDCGGAQHRLRREFPWFHGATGKTECPPPAAPAVRAYPVWPVEAIHPETGRSRRYDVAAPDASEAHHTARSILAEELGVPTTEIDTRAIGDAR